MDIENTSNTQPDDQMVFNAGENNNTVEQVADQPKKPRKQNKTILKPEHLTNKDTGLCALYLTMKKHK